MRRKLSSARTVFYKVVLPVVWIGAFALVTLSLFVVPPKPVAPEERWVFLAATVLGTAVFYWFFMRLKTVSLHGDILIISDYGREIEVPLRDVERVSGSILMSPELIWLHFRHPTEFGSKIVFMPPWRSSWGLSNPLVAELRRQVAQASGGAVEQTAGLPQP